MAKDIADAFRADGPATAREFLVVRGALAESGTPEQVKNLTEGVRAELSPGERGQRPFPLCHRRPQVLGSARFS